MRLLLDVGAATDVGKVREHNEDCFTTARFGGGDLLMVCDGMGGHAAGDLASRIACSAITASVLAMQQTDPRELLYRAAQKAHDEVRQAAEASPEAHGMGTTCVVALVREGQLYLGNVGDSRLYLVRDGAVRQLSVDQTKVQHMVEHGVLTPAEARKHPEAGVLSQAIGHKQEIEPYVEPTADGIALRDGDALLLCSDGVYDCMDDATILRLSAAETAARVAQAMVEHAVTVDGKDNATAVVARVVAPSAELPGKHVSGPAARQTLVEPQTPDPADSGAAWLRRHRASTALAGAFLLLAGVALGAMIRSGAGGRKQAPSASTEPAPKTKPPFGTPGTGDGARRPVAASSNPGPLKSDQAAPADASTEQAMEEASANARTDMHKGKQTPRPLSKDVTRRGPAKAKAR